MQYSSVEESSAAEVVLPPMVSLKKGHCPDRVLDYLLNTRGIDPDDLSLHTGCGWSDHPAWATDPVGQADLSRVAEPKPGRLAGKGHLTRIWNALKLRLERRSRSITSRQGPTRTLACTTWTSPAWCPIGVLVEGGH